MSVTHSLDTATSRANPAPSPMETAKVSALRETSAVFAALTGTLFLGESFGRRRLVAALALAAGLVLMQFG